MFAWPCKHQAWDPAQERVHHSYRRSKPPTPSSSWTIVPTSEPELLLDTHQVCEGQAPETFAPETETQIIMRTNRLLSIFSWMLIGISVLGILSVSFMAFSDPQAVMDLVQVKLDNTDAYSSIRGVYGGVGIAILGVLLYLVFTDRKAALGFIALITISMEGPLGDFGSQWLVIESTLSLVALGLLAWRIRWERHATAV